MKVNVSGESFLIIGFALVSFFVLSGAFLMVEYFPETTLSGTFTSNVRNILCVVFLVLIVFSCIIVYDAFLNWRYRTELAEYREKTKNLVDAKHRFISHMSHEMKTPLHAIVGIARQMKQMGDLGMSRPDMLDKLETSSVHLQKMVENLLMFSEENLEVNEGDESFDPGQIIEDVAETYRTEAEKKQLGFAVVSKINHNKRLKGNYVEIQQILGYLLDNSIKFTQDGKIELSYWVKELGKKQGMLYLSILDTGVGISSERLPYIFEGGEHGNYQAVLTKEHVGMGLGLALCKRLVGSKGGTIKVESKEGVYTKFEVSIPFQYGAEGVSASTPSWNINENTALSVLVVDDDEFNVLLASSFLKKKQCRVTTALDGQKALEYLEYCSFDIILLDIHMPRMSGLEVAETLRKSNGINQNTPILAVTATSLNEVLLKQFKRVGIDDFLPKPYTTEVLWQKMHALMDRKIIPFEQSKMA